MGYFFLGYVAGVASLMVLRRVLFNANKIIENGGVN